MVSNRQLIFRVKHTSVVKTRTDGIRWPSFMDRDGFPLRVAKFFEVCENVQDYTEISGDISMSRKKRFKKITD